MTAFGFQVYAFAMLIVNHEDSKNEAILRYAELNFVISTTNTLIPFTSWPSSPLTPAAYETFHPAGGQPP